MFFRHIFALLLVYASDNATSARFWTGVELGIDIFTAPLVAATAFKSACALRRAWALMELTGNLASISVNTRVLPEELKPAIDTYNAVFALLDLGAGGVRSVNAYYKKIQDASADTKLPEALDAFNREMGRIENSAVLASSPHRDKLRQMRKISKVARSRGNALVRLDPSKARQYAARHLSYEGANVQRGILFFRGALQNRQTGVIDVLVHGEGDKFVLYLARAGVVEERTLTGAELAQVLATLPNPPATIRLLSCANLQAAEDLARALNRPVIATAGKVEVYADGGITSTTDEWFEISPTGKHTPTAKPEPPKNGVKGKVRMGGSLESLADFMGLQGKSVDEIVTMIPTRAETRTFTMHNSHITEAHPQKYTWRTSEGIDVELWMHGPDTNPNIPLNSNARLGWVLRIRAKINTDAHPSHLGRAWFVDKHGNLHKENVLNERSPEYDAGIANDCHIPIIR